MADLLFQVLSLLMLGLVPAILLIGVLAAVPTIWLVGCVIFRRTSQSMTPVTVAETSSASR